MRQVQIVDTKRLELNVRPKMFRCPWCPTVTERRQPSTLFVAYRSSESDTQAHAQATPIDYKDNVNQMLTKKLSYKIHRNTCWKLYVSMARFNSNYYEKQSNERYVTNIEN